MEIIVFLSGTVAALTVLTALVLIRRVKKQIAEMTDALMDVKNGNGNRRILAAANELTAPIAYEINEIVVAYESRLSTVRQTEETNRQLMTSLSHDVRTPLTTLIGYLDAAHKGLVAGKERDDYIETARRKAHDLKEYIDVLFDWFKLNSDEFALEIRSVEAAELTRNILIDWIPIFEDKQVDYDIDIPTSLSHDVRTPLTTLIGYLDAAHKGLVAGKERDDYIETARRKAHDLKEYIDVLFDWFKLNSDEFALEIRSVEAAELTRNILIDWIPIFEDKQVDYDIDIPEQPVWVRLDTDSYMRIINNLIQNVIAHSHADKIKIALSKKENNMELLLADNGVGIEKEDLKHIFERLYKCDKGRSETHF